ncbi:MAG: hypothetical protein RPU34_12500 [Candidatus Sedimenticola sp. (ex Thyasira tokunagai)]
MGFKKPGKEKGKLKAKDTSREIDYDMERPRFALQHLQSGYCVQNCTRDEKAALADRMRILSQLTWQQLRNADRHGLGYEKISTGSLNVAIPPALKDDVSFIAFRFKGKAPMVGYKENSTFFIVWLDRDFTLYKHG